MYDFPMLKARHVWAEGFDKLCTHQDSEAWCNKWQAYVEVDVNNMWCYAICNMYVYIYIYYVLTIFLCIHIYIDVCVCASIFEHIHASVFLIPKTIQPSAIGDMQPVHPSSLFPAAKWCGSWSRIHELFFNPELFIMSSIMLPLWLFNIAMEAMAHRNRWFTY